ncbi:hypothetical protein, partial [Klebsiella variicola]
GLFLRTAVNDFMDSVHHIWCPLSSQKYQDLPDGAETTLTNKACNQPVKSSIRLSLYDNLASGIYPTETVASTKW